MPLVTLNFDSYFKWNTISKSEFIFVIEHNIRIVIQISNRTLNRMLIQILNGTQYSNFGSNFNGTLYRNVISNGTQYSSCDSYLK